MNPTKDVVLKSFGISQSNNSTTDSGDVDNSSANVGLDDMQSAITILVDTLLQAQNYTTIDAETYELLRKRLVSRAEDFVNASLLKSLSDSEQAEFATLLDSGTSTDQELYLREHIPEIHKVIHAGLKAFCDAYMSDENQESKSV